jgi:hypothetical protein
MAVTAIAPPRKVLVEYTPTEAATTLGALVSRREHLAERLARLNNGRLKDDSTSIRAWVAGLERELADTEAAEAALRRALQVRT